jgi:hypothetical protein
MYKPRSAERIDTHTAENIATGHYSEKEQVAIGKEIIGKKQEDAVAFIRKVKSFNKRPSGYCWRNSVAILYR